MLVENRLLDILPAEAFHFVRGVFLSSSEKFLRNFCGWFYFSCFNNFLEGLELWRGKAQCLPAEFEHVECFFIWIPIRSWTIFSSRALGTSQIPSAWDWKSSDSRMREVATRSGPTFGWSKAWLMWDRASKQKLEPCTEKKIMHPKGPSGVHMTYPKEWKLIGPRQSLNNRTAFRFGWQVKNDISKLSRAWKNLTRCFTFRCANLLSSVWAQKVRFRIFLSRNTSKSD